MYTASVEAGEEYGEDIEIDLSEAVSFEPFNADKLPVEIVGAKLKKGTESGKPYVELQLLSFGDHEYAGRTLWTNINLTGKGAGIGFDQLEAFGATSKSGEPVSRENPKLHLPGLVGLLGLAKVRIGKDRTVNGQHYEGRAEVKAIKPYISPDEEAAADLQ